MNKAVKKNNNKNNNSEKIIQNNKILLEDNKKVKNKYKKTKNEKIVLDDMNNSTDNQNYFQEDFTNNIANNTGKCSDTEINTTSEQQTNLSDFFSSIGGILKNQNTETKSSSISNSIGDLVASVIKNKNFNPNYNSNSNPVSESNTNSSVDIVIHVRKECVMHIFEYLIKRQLIEITGYGITKRVDENSELTYEETVKKMDAILTSIENDPGFINLSMDELYIELENIPSQEDYECFCNEYSYEKKLNKENSTQKEKLNTIMYTLIYNCVEPNINIKKIILSVIKYEFIRNELVEIIKKHNANNEQYETLDFITADMMFMSLKYFLPRSDMKVISRNIAYYFSKIC